ncbi:MAG: DUF4835 family protein [Tannerella sp.]|jgi:hypothetical protein|nr:DUF4835 family protein [Tannerella sp.]
MNRFKTWVALCFLLLAPGLRAQELNMTISINSEKVQGTNKQIFSTLQKALTEFVNNRKWTDAHFSTNEKIDCSMTFIVNSYDESTNAFKTQLQVQARRPVYNSSYSTTTLNFQDAQVDFSYVEFSPLQYAANTLDNNLTATVVYYVYLILGIDFDSFSPRGGTSYFQQAQQIVTMAQSQPAWTGWKAFDSPRNRHAVITAIMEDEAGGLRDMWYNYHRKGLDQMAANPELGRNTIIASLQALDAYYKTRPTSVLLQMFSDAKLAEIVAIYSKANTQEKQDGYKLLSKIYPTAGSKLDALKQ